eukprot:g9936.t1
MEGVQVIGVDFEGVKLCRDGEMCLMQVVLDSNPVRVFVIDIHVLGKTAFTLSVRRKGSGAGAGGEKSAEEQEDSDAFLGKTTEPDPLISLKRVLESPWITKSWFDCRNDCDSLWAQFGILPKRVFDVYACGSCPRGQLPSAREK